MEQWLVYFGCVCGHQFAPDGGSVIHGEGEVPSALVVWWEVKPWPCVVQMMLRSAPKLVGVHDYQELARLLWRR